MSEDEGCVSPAENVACLIREDSCWEEPELPNTLEKGWLLAASDATVIEDGCEDGTDIFLPSDAVVNDGVVVVSTTLES